MFLLQVVKVIEFILIILFLIYASVFDLKWHSVPVIPVIAVLILEVAAGLFLRGRSHVIISLIPGIVILLLSLCKGSGIGVGDGFVAMITGLFLGIEGELVSLYFSFILSGIFSVGLIAVKKGNKRTEIPFVPFMAAGFLIEKAVTL